VATVIEERDVIAFEEGVGGVPIGIEGIRDARGEDISVAGTDEAKYDGAARTGVHRGTLLRPALYVVVHGRPR
jgi:hypothetical protein